MIQVRAFYPGYNSGNANTVRAFAEGVPGCTIHPDSEYIPCRIMVIFGLVKNVFPKSWAKRHLLDAHQGPVIVVERGYINREKYYSAGFGGINGRADFKNYDVPCDRWDRHCLELRPWKASGDYVLVCGQVPWDVTVQDTDHKEWCRQTIKSLRSMGYESRFRPHPYAHKKGVDYGVPRETVIRSLDDDLAGAWAVVTHSSNVGVDAVIQGIPTIAMDQEGTMTRGVSGRSLLDLPDPVKSDREKWAHRISYAQWTKDEFRAGLAWRHLSKDLV